MSVHLWRSVTQCTDLLLQADILIAEQIIAVAVAAVGSDREE